MIKPHGSKELMPKIVNTDEEKESLLKAAESMKITSTDLMDLGIIDNIIDEPLGGAHREPVQMISQVKTHLRDTLTELNKFTVEELIQTRRDKFLKIGKDL